MGEWLLRFSRVVLLLQLLLRNSCVEGQELPELPDYFSGYVEGLSMSSVMNLNATYMSHNLSRQYFDKTIQMSRVDGPANSLYPGVPGMLSIITDLPHKVTYYIQRDTRNCTIESLMIPIGGGGIVAGPNGSYHYASLDSVFYLTNASDYTYVGNSSAHGVVLDDWTFTGDITVPNITYHNVTIDISIARNGAPSLVGIKSDPVPWRISIQGVITYIDLYNVTISTVARFFDLSFEEPHDDVFDVSVCVKPEDYVVLVMVVPKNSNKVDYRIFRKNVKKAVVGYTKVLPVQVGAIEVVLDNGTALFTTLQISNLTTKVEVSDVVTAVAALDKISIGSAENGALPFQIEISSGVMVTPHAVSVEVIDGGNNPSPANSSVMPSLSTSSSEMPSSSVENSMTSMMPQSTMHGSSTVEPPPMPTTMSIIPEPSMTSSSVVPSISTSTTTVTVTATPSSCPTAPPLSNGKTYSKSYVIGLAFGMIILGAAIAIISLLIIVFFCFRYKKFSFRTGYERQINIDD